MTTLPLLLTDTSVELVIDMVLFVFAVLIAIDLTREIWRRAA